MDIVDLLRNTVIFLTSLSMWILVLTKRRYFKLEFIALNISILLCFISLFTKPFLYSLLCFTALGFIIRSIDTESYVDILEEK